MPATQDNLERLRKLWIEAEIEWLNALEAEDEVMERTLPSARISVEGDARDTATSMDPETLQKNLQEQQAVKERINDAAQRLKESEQAYFHALDALKP